MNAPTGWRSVVVGGEQLLACDAVEHVRELPGEVVAVLDAAVAAEPAGGGHHMRRVAGNEHTAVPKPLGVLRRRRPALHVLDLDRDVRIAERLADVADAGRRAHVLPDANRPRSLAVDCRVHDEEARLQVDREAEEPLQPRPEDVDHAEVAIPHQPADIGPEVDRDAVREAAVAENANSEPLADRAVRTVGCDHVPGSHGSLRPAVSRVHDHRHAVAVLLQRGGLGCVLDPRSQTLRGSEQDRLEPDLRDEEPRRRADLLDALVDEAEVPVELLPAEALDGHDRPVLDELPCCRLLDLVLQADRAVRLDRALVDQCGARVDRGAAVPLDDERGHTVMPEEHRRRQSDEAASDDQDGNVFVLHLGLLDSNAERSVGPPLVPEH